MTDQRTTGSGVDTRVGSVGELIVAVVALAAGAAIAWVDTRPTWDDAGITAGALLLTAGIAAAVGLRWWGAALAVATPILFAELPKAGWGILVALAFTSLGALLGTALRRVARSMKSG